MLIVQFKLILATLSANTVGYVTYELQANKQDIGGVPFLNAGGGELDIQNIKLSNGSDGGDWIKIFNPETRTYDTLYWFASLYDMDENENDVDLEMSGWGIDEYVVKPTVTIQPGQGFWIQTKKNNTMTIAGQVCSAVNAENTQSLMANKQDLLAALFPVETDVQDIKLSNGSDGGDWIKIFNPETRTYDTLYWFASLYDLDENEDDVDLEMSGWGIDEYIVKPAIKIQPGQGFWIQTKKANTVTFTSIKE